MRLINDVRCLTIGEFGDILKCLLAGVFAYAAVELGGFTGGGALDSTEAVKSVEAAVSAAARFTRRCD